MSKKKLTNEEFSESVAIAAMKATEKAEQKEALDESEGGLVSTDQLEDAPSKEDFELVDEKAPVEKEPETEAPVSPTKDKTIMEQAADMALINAGKLKRA